MKINIRLVKDYKKFGLFGLLILIMLLMIVSISKDFFNSPSVGVVEETKVVSANRLTLISFEGKNFSFSYPNLFQPIESSPVNGSDIEKYAFVANQAAMWNLDIKISSISQADLKYDGNYNLRKTNPQTYTEEVKTLGNNKAHIMTDSAGGYNKVVFLLNSKIDATILLSSSSSLDSTRMDAALYQMIASWKWL